MRLTVVEFQLSSYRDFLVIDDKVFLDSKFTKLLSWNFAGMSNL